MSENLLPNGKLWICTDHDVHCVVNTVSVIWAASECEASGVLRLQLKKRGLDPSAPFTLQPVPLCAPVAVILSDGNY